MAEMVRLSGQTLAPVIEVDGKILADFGPEELAPFWEKLKVEYFPSPASPIFCLCFRRSFVDKLRPWF